MWIRYSTQEDMEQSYSEIPIMDSSRPSLPNVDRANSTLFKRYLDEQHKSVVKTNHYPQLPHPINSTIQITHTHRQQDASTSKYSNNNNNSNSSTHHQPPVLSKRKSSNGRKPSGDSTKQRSSHTSRFMKRFQRQYKNGETAANVQKRDARPRFEFHNSSSATTMTTTTTTKQTRVDQPIRCTCLVSSDRNRGDDHQHHPHCPAKSAQVPRLSFNELLHTTSQYRRPTIPGAITLPPTSPKTSRSPLPMLPPSAIPSIREETLSHLTYPIESNPLPSPSSINNPESETLILDTPVLNLSNEYYPIINDFLQELSMEMNAKPSVDMLLEIEESLAQRIYDCIIEQTDEDQMEHDTISYSTTTNDSSAISAPPPPLPMNKNISLESNDLPPSPINPAAKVPMDNREKYFQPIREPVTTTFDNLLDRNRHSTPFHRIDRQIENEVRSPFTQSLFEPVNLLRTVNANNDDFNFFPPSFSFEQHSSKNEQTTSTAFPQSLPFFNHLLSPRTTPIEKNFSAFKPIESSTTRPITSFPFKPPQAINNPTGVHWFGQS